MMAIRRASLPCFLLVLLGGSCTPATQAQSSQAVAEEAAATAPEPVLMWRMQRSGTDAGLRGIDSVNGKIAWASGTGGTVLRTLDGGANWSKCATPGAGDGGETLDFRGVQAWDADTAMVMASGPGDKSRLYKTTDGCKTWKLLFRNPDAPDGFFDSVYFPKSQGLPGDHKGFGLLLGDPVGGQFTVLETRDGGYTWTKLSDKILAASSAEAGAFAASNSCLSGYGAATFDMVVGGKAGSSLFRVDYEGGFLGNDGSKQARIWRKTSLPLGPASESSGPFSIYRRARVTLNPTRIWVTDVVVGGDYTKPNESSGTAAFSTDGGMRWTAAAKPPHGYRSSVAWSESLKAWIAVGTNGSDISHDDGATWEPFDDGNWNALGLPFVVGPKGRIAKLAGAGAN